MPSLSLLSPLLSPLLNFPATIQMLCERKLSLTRGSRAYIQWTPQPPETADIMCLGMKHQAITCSYCSLIYSWKWSNVCNKMQFHRCFYLSLIIVQYYERLCSSWKRHSQHYSVGIKTKLVQFTRLGWINSISIYNHGNLLRSRLIVPLITIFRYQPIKKLLGQKEFFL